ncbi:MAG: hypothetical protein HQ568_11965 [Calditrichaeota bacterium]|nr:hypothetical protein [Calditrichota bacterium]
MESTSVDKIDSIHVEYLILVRHGAREKPYNFHRVHHRLENAEGGEGYKEKNGKRFAEREKEGRPKSLSLAGWLAEALSYYDVKVSSIWSSAQKHAKETAIAYKEVLNDQHFLANECPIISVSDLNPEVFWEKIEIYKKINKKIKYIKNSKVLLICGHQPQLTWLFNDLIRKRRPLPLRQSEAAFIKLSPKPQLLWAISDIDNVSLSELKDKIKSKMDIAKFFAGFISLLIGIIFSQMSELLIIPNKINISIEFIKLILPHIGVFLIFLSLILCVVTLFAYDKLLMPTVFWSGKPTKYMNEPQKWTVKRPPSQTHWILYSNMTHIWNYLFTFAVLSFFIGLSVLLLSIIRPYRVGLLISFFCLIIAFIIYKIVEPKLGFDD